MKGNKYRIIFWGIILLITLSSSVVGIIYYNKGYGVMGKVLLETKPIANTFNNLQSIKLYEKLDINVKAKAKNDKINVIYDSGILKASFTFNYSNTNDIKTLTFKYNANDKDIGNLISELMIDSISVLKGHKEKEVFERYELNDFYNTTIEDGVKITNSGNMITVVINISKSLLDKESNNEIIDNNNDNEIINNNEEVIPTDEITYNNALELINTISINSSVSKKINKMSIRIDMLDSSYTLFIADERNTYSLDMYNSIKNIINAISGEDVLNSFISICPELNNINYENGPIFYITYDVSEVRDYEEFKDNTKVLKIVVNK